MEKILSGKEIASLLRRGIKDLVAEQQIVPKMLLIQVGDDAASAYYVKSIINNAPKLGCEAELLSLPDSSSEADLLHTIRLANENPAIHGILIQKPLPKGFDDN